MDLYAEIVRTQREAAMKEMARLAEYRRQYPGYSVSAWYSDYITSLSIGGKRYRYDEYSDEELGKIYADTYLGPGSSSWDTCPVDMEAEIVSPMPSDVMVVKHMCM